MRNLKGIPKTDDFWNCEKMLQEKDNISCCFYKHFFKLDITEEITTKNSRERHKTIIILRDDDQVTENLGGTAHFASKLKVRSAHTHCIPVVLHSKSNLTHT